MPLPAFGESLSHRGIAGTALEELSFRLAVELSCVERIDISSCQRTFDERVNFARSTVTAALRRDRHRCLIRLQSYEEPSLGLMRPPVPRSAA
ncbi:MAG: hypothetical protein R3C19_24210 [Planctomycetaceae bacterium]